MAPRPPLTPEQLQAAVDFAFLSRHSVRAFLPTPVPRETIAAILAVASRAPSGTNIQPWRVHVLIGGARERVSSAILAVQANPEALAAHVDEWDYYPKEWRSPFLERRRKVGQDLYGLLGIGKADRTRMAEQWARNFRFFDAPVGLIFTIDRILRQGSFLDYGGFLQGVMVAARARGLDTCPQAAFMQFHALLAAQLGLSPEEQVVCGMSLGFADPTRPENALRTEREPVSAFTTFHE